MTITNAAMPFDPEGYQAPHAASDLEAAHFSPLTAVPKSSAAQEACDKLIDTAILQRVTRKQRKAYYALLADLVQRDPGDRGGWLYRSKDPKSFTGAAIGYRPFVNAYAAMTDGLIEELLGNRVWGPSAIAKSGKAPMWQRATRFRATPRLLDWFTDRGITHENWSEHFTRNLAAPQAFKALCSVVLRPGKPPRHFKVSKAYPIPLDRSDLTVAKLVARVDRINSYLATADVVPHGPVFLRRIFAHGDDPAHGWQQGGRLYAIGSSPYQTAKRANRAEITIGGEATCELDIQASHLTILAALGHIPRFVGDPYAIVGLPRPVVKQWVNMTLSHGKRHVRWPQGAVETLRKDHGIDVKTDYPLTKTGDLILRHLPILKAAGGSGVSVGWGELQFRESEVVLTAVEALAFNHDIPALPVHDSLIVPRGAETVAKLALGKAFREAFGIDAVIE